MAHRLCLCRRRVRGEQAPGEGEQCGHHWGYRWIQWHHCGRPRSGTSVSNAQASQTYTPLYDWYVYRWSGAKTYHSFRLRGWQTRLHFRSTSCSINQLQILFSHFSCNSINATPALTPLQLGCCAWRLATAQLPRRTGRSAVSLGGWLHNVRLASHGTRFPLVSLHRAEFPSFSEVGIPRCQSEWNFMLLLIVHSGDTATCLHNAPHEDSALGRSLPGTLLSLDAQCRRDRGTYACFKDERVCAQLFCFDAQTGYCVAYRPAAEGSACGNGYVSWGRESSRELSIQSHSNLCLPLLSRCSTVWMVVVLRYPPTSYPTMATTIVWSTSKYRSYAFKSTLSVVVGWVSLEFWLI